MSTMSSMPLYAASAKCARPSSSVCGVRSAASSQSWASSSSPLPSAMLGEHVELDHVDAGASAASKDVERVAGRDVVGALVPDAPHRAGSRRSRAHADIPRTSRSGGCRRPGRGCGSARRSAGTGRPALRVDDAVQILHPVQRGLLHPRARGAHDRQRLVVADVARRPPRVDRRRRSSPRTSTGCRCPAIVRWSSSASPIERVGSSARRRAQELGARRARARGCRGRASPGGGRSACATRSAARAPARRTGRPRRRRCAGPARRGDAARRQRWPSRYVPQDPVIRRCEWIARSPSKRTKRCLPCASTLRDGAAGELLGPALAAQARVGVRDLRDRGPSTSGRIRRAA